MNCKEARKALESLVAGNLSGEDARAVRMHFKTCSACAAKLDPSHWVELLPVLDAEIEPSPDFALRLKARLDARTQPWWRKIPVWDWPRQLAAAGALAAVIFAAVLAIRYPGAGKDPSASLNDYTVAEQLPLLKDMPVVSNLDLLEDFDAIENLSNLMQQEKSVPPAASDRH
jgi:hypothetical protein